MRHPFSLILIVLVACSVSCSSCENTERSSGWSFDESGPEQWQKLEGLPGPLYIPLGRVGERHYFRTGYRSWGGLLYSGGQIIVAHYTPGEGWREDRRLADLLSGDEYPLPFALDGHPLSMVEAGGQHFFVDIADNTLARTPDGGQTWEPTAPLPAEEGISQLTSDGTHLFLLVRDSEGEEQSLWRSDDDGASWEQIHHDGHLDKIVGLDGQILGEADGGLRLSENGGDTWREAHDSCQELPQHANFVSLDERRLALINGDLVEFAPDAGCSPLGLDALTGDESIGDVVMADGKVYGATSSHIWRANLELMRWEEVATPEGVELQAGSHQGVRKTLYDLGESGIGMLNWNGLWQFDEQVADWRFVGHDFSLPRAIIEHQGAVIATTSSDWFRRNGLEGAWRPLKVRPHFDEPLHRGAAMARHGRLFGSTTWPSVYEVMPDDGSHSLIWEDPMTDAMNSSGSGRSAELIFHDGRVLISSRGNQRAAYRPGSSRAAEYRQHLGGGVFWAESTGDEFQLFGDGLPVEDDGTPPSIQSMVVHDGALWVVTAADGVWRAGLDDGHWTSDHVGLPEGDGPQAAAVQTLSATNGRLYAYSTEVVYVREEQRWRRLTTEAFAATLSDSDYHRIIEVSTYRGELLIITHYGVYAFDEQSGEERRVWQPETGWITTAAVLSSGLYLGVGFDGIWRYGPPE